MKKNLRILRYALLILCILALTKISTAQEPPHPPASGHGQQGNQAPGGNAPVGGGEGILILLSAAYLLKRSGKPTSTQLL